MNDPLTPPRPVRPSPDSAHRQIPAKPPASPMAAQVVRDPAERQIPPKQKTVPATPQIAQEAIEAPKGLLDWLEELLARMLWGLLKFPFIRLPQLVTRFAERVFPTVVRVAKITLMFGTWLLLTVVPGIIAWQWTILSGCLGKYNIVIPPPISAHKQIGQSVLMGWCCLAICGSGWGLIAIQRRRRRRRLT